MLQALPTCKWRPWDLTQKTVVFLIPLDISNSFPNACIMALLGFLLGVFFKCFGIRFVHGHIWDLVVFIYGRMILWFGFIVTIGALA